MSSISEREDARTYETLFALMGDEAYGRYRKLASAADVREPLPSYIGSVADIIGYPADEVLEKWRAVRDAFDADKATAAVLSDESQYFPVMNGACFPFIYASGNVPLMLGRFVCFLGSPQPSVHARSIVLEAVASAVDAGGTVIAPMEPGIPAFALQIALKLGGKAIGVLASPLSKCPSASLLELQKNLYSQGLLLSVFAPSRKTERWFQKIRNSFLSSIVSSAFLAEEKDGGPSWPVADSVHGKGLLMMPEAIASNPAFTWMGKRCSEGALLYRKRKDIVRIIPRKERTAVPDLFS